MRPNATGWWMTTRNQVVEVFDVYGRLCIEGDFSHIYLDTIEADWDTWEPVPPVEEIRRLRAIAAEHAECGRDCE